MLEISSCIQGWYPSKSQSPLTAARSGVHAQPEASIQSANISVGAALVGAGVAITKGPAGTAFKGAHYFSGQGHQCIDQKCHVEQSRLTTEAVAREPCRTSSHSSLDVKCRLAWRPTRYTVGQIGDGCCKNSLPAIRAPCFQSRIGTRAIYISVLLGQHTGCSEAGCFTIIRGVAAPPA
jgi:hypothetical protein